MRNMLRITYHNISYLSRSKIATLPRGFEAFGLHANFRGVVLFEQIESCVVQDREVVRRVVPADMILAFAEG